MASVPSNGIEWLIRNGLEKEWNIAWMNSLNKSHPESRIAEGITRTPDEVKERERLLNLENDIQKKMLNSVMEHLIVKSDFEQSDVEDFEPKPKAPEINNELVVELNEMHNQLAVLEKKLLEKESKIKKILREKIQKEFEKNLENELYELYPDSDRKKRKVPDYSLDTLANEIKQNKEAGLSSLDKDKWQNIAILSKSVKDDVKYLTLNISKTLGRTKRVHSAAQNYSLEYSVDYEQENNEENSKASDTRKRVLESIRSNRKRIWGS